jgi:6-phosphogluconolactonase
LPPYASEVDWARTELFFGDERCVPPWDAGSNYAMVRHALLERVPVPEVNVHRMRGEDEPERAARDYEDVLERVLGATPLDLVLLGMGENGHTASLFPGSALLGEPRRRVAAEYVRELAMWRITLTPLAINAARHAAFLVSGAPKAPMLAQVLEGPRDPARLPAQIVQPAGELRWLVDAAAAARLRQGGALSLN